MDRTVAFDDTLTERFRRCMLCPHHAVWMDVRLVEGRYWLGCLCGRCHSARGWPAIDQVLRERYGVQDTSAMREVPYVKRATA